MNGCRTLPRSPEQPVLLKGPPATSRKRGSHPPTGAGRGGGH